MGSPQERRRFLNLFIAQHDPIYLHHLLRYQKALKARNVLLKRGSKTTIAAYESLLALHAVAITKARQKAIQELEPLFQKQFLEIMQKDLPTSIEYSFKDEPSEDFYLGEYAKNRQQEERLGSTITGPHRDDCKFFINNLEAKHFSSEGQKRALLTALKLAELQLLKNKTGLDPILFIDDFAIHLDLYRCKQLENVVQNYPQVFLTTPQSVFENGSLYFVQDLKVQKLNSYLTS
jgi:DNA replication and repair protein RecF